MSVALMYRTTHANMFGMLCTQSPYRSGVARGRWGSCVATHALPYALAWGRALGSYVLACHAVLSPAAVARAGTACVWPSASARPSPRQGGAHPLEAVQRGYTAPLRL